MSETTHPPRPTPTDPGADPAAVGPLRLAVVLGSIRPGRFGPVPATWFTGEARRHPAFGAGRVDLVDLVDHALPPELRAFDATPPPAVTELGARLAGADAFVVVTPEYNHSFPSGLKTAVDWFGTEWRAKPVGFVSYGGTAGGLRAVEHLRAVFAELHAVTMRDLVSFHGAGAFDDDGGPVDPAATRAATTLLDQLAWWGRTLADGRRARPYVRDR